MPTAVIKSTKQIIQSSSSTLVGRIYYNVSKNNHDTACDNGKKRPRSWDGDVCIDDSSVQGFIFSPNDSTQQLLASVYHSKYHAFCLVIPYEALRMACYAASRGKLVQISQYSMICYRDGWGELKFSCSNNGSNNVIPTDGVLLQSKGGTSSFMTIEIHQNGFSLVSSEKIGHNYQVQSTEKHEAMTLDTLAQKEAQNKLSGSKSTKKSSIGKDPMNVIGIVDAISPILMNDSSGEEPFAIVELYQLVPTGDGGESANVKSAVAIIRGEQALCMHPAIHPGQTITLVGVTSRKWKVPDVFKKQLDIVANEVSDNRNNLYQRLNHRVPDRVLLVTEASTIRWNDEYELGGRVDDISLPSTVGSLRSIRGIVQSVHYHLSQSKDGKRKASHVVHFVTLKLLEPTTKKLSAKEKLVRMYLPKYPLAPNLSLGLQPGCILRAINIHEIISLSTVDTEQCEFTKEKRVHLQSFVACLRSTIAIERCAGESYHHVRSSSQPWFVPRDTAFSMVPDHRITDMCSDPFNTKSSEQYLAEGKLRRELVTKHDDQSSVDNATSSLSHQSTSSDRVEYAQTYYAECNNTKSSEKQITHQPNSINTKIDALLEHHHRFVTAGMLSNSNYQRGNCIPRDTNRINVGQNGRQSMRDPYAEFFDHAHNDTFSNATECGSSCNEFSSFNHFYNLTSNAGVPHVVDLNDLRNACAQNFVNRVTISMHSKLNQHSTISSGWMSSHHFQGLKLGQVLNDYSQSKIWYDVSNNSTPSFYVWGTVEVDSDSYPTSTLLFRDIACTIPICEIKKEATESETLQFQSTGSPTWMHLDSVIVSCLCLGSSQKGHAIESKDLNGNIEYEENHTRGSTPQISSHAFLPSMVDDIDRKALNSDGHSFIFVVNNLVFIASVHLAAKSVVSLDSNRRLREKAEALQVLRKSREMKSAAPKRADLISIQECLEQTASELLQKNPVSIIGRLVRQRLAFRKLKSTQINDGPQLQHNKFYEGWTAVLSHIDPVDKDVLDDASTLQTIEVRISVLFDKCTQARSDALRLALQKLTYQLITADQVTMGLAWWIASNSSKTLSLLSGGWEEGHDHTSTEMNNMQSSVYVKIPYSARIFSKLGYQRFRCNLHELNAFFVPHRQMREHTNSTKFCGTGKFLPGMLTRRLHRVPPLVFNTDGIKEPNFQYRNQYSLLTKLKREGVPSATLEELHWDICSALEEGDHSHLRPSLLRRIHNVKILGISFCRARAECTQCFQALTSGPSKSVGRSKSHFSLSPLDSEKRRLLSCPSGCSRLHGAVKWECSALIDDGTGQAKIYTEREAALLLLGGSLDVAVIEDGVWEVDNGIFFQPSLPASSYLMQCIKDATIKARRYTSESKLNKNRTEKTSHDEDLPTSYSLLPADAKAEYLLHQHCRQWYQQYHNRKMDLFCHCKPLSEDTTTVNQTEIQVAKAWVANVALDFGATSTATLPPLKLTLVDACVACEDSHDGNISGWNRLHFESD